MTHSIVQIYCDANKSIGFGHITRCIALYKYFNLCNLKTSIFGLSIEANNFLGDNAYENKNAEIFILDINYLIHDEFLFYLKKKSNKIITLDWFGKEVPHINIVVFPHFEVKALNKNFIGFDYIIIRDEILKTNNNKTNKDTALVCIGGGDILSQSEAAAEILIKKGYEVKIIKGPTSKVSKNNLYETLYKPKHFSKILACSDLIVTNGGGTMFESIYLKKNTISIPQTEFEMNVANYAFNNRSIMGIGLESLKSLNSSLLNNDITHSDFIDGNGVKRIFQIVKSCLID